MLKKNYDRSPVPGDNGLSLGVAILVAKENGFKIDKYQTHSGGQNIQMNR